MAYVTCKLMFESIFLASDVVGGGLGWTNNSGLN